MIYIIGIFFISLSSVICLPGGRQNILRLARDDKTFKPAATRIDYNGAEVIKTLLASRSLDRLGGGEVLRVLDPLSGGQMVRALEQLGTAHNLDAFRGGEVLGVLDRLTGGEMIGSLEMVDGTSVLTALERARQTRAHQNRQAPKRTLDTLTGMAFGESKRFDSLSGSTFGLSKRDFDEIDNVGFTGFAKRAPGGYRSSMLALAKKNFDEIDRAGFETYNKRNFDEIDRAGFETYNKRATK